MKLKTIAYAALVVAAAFAFALGSATTGEAKAKKKKAAAPPPAQPMWCFNEVKPVCGELRGHKFTYANTCSAYKDGAKVVSSKACSVKKAHKAKKAKKAKKKPAKKAAAKKKM